METIPARRGKATPLKRGQSIRIVNTHGAQVVDSWEFTAGGLAEFMSMEHTRATVPTACSPRCRRSASRRPECPRPANLFVNIPWTADGRLSFDPPTAKPGDHVTLRRHVGLPAGHPADQRPNRHDDRSPLRDPELRP